MTMPDRVAIIGTGLIGRGWAAAFARAGWGVALWDQDAASRDAAHAAVGRSLDDLADAGLLDDANSAKARVSVADTPETAVEGAGYIQESVPEKAEIKTQVFERLDAIAPAGVLIGSSTSTLPGSAFLASIANRDRCIVAHPANPPHLMPVVEIVPSAWHAPETVERVCAIMRAIGQVPVTVNREIEGFVMNRLQTAVVNEAVALVAQGVVEPDGLDAIMKHSLGLRWALMGPFETMDLNAPNGFFDYASRYGHLYQALGRDLSVADPWPDDALMAIEQSRRDATPSGTALERMRDRDRALMRLLALKKSINDGQEERI